MDYAQSRLPGARGVLRVRDGAFIPEDSGNADWRAFEAWRDAGNAPAGSPAAAPVVTEVQLWQARVALERHGLAARAAAAIAASNDDALKAAWDYGNTISRASPGLAAIAAALSLDASAVDALFAEAATITV